MSDNRIPITRTLSIDPADLTERFVVAGGPGGQHVNKVASAVQLRYNPRAAGDLPDGVIVRAEKLAGSRLTGDGDIIIASSRHRSQDRNREDARERLVELLKEAAKPPAPPRKATKPSKSARKKRVDSKVKRGAVKKLRGRVTRD
jgi:ribosome-associated protein